MVISPEPVEVAPTLTAALSVMKIFPEPVTEDTSVEAVVSKSPEPDAPIPLADSKVI